MPDEIIPLKKIIDFVVDLEEKLIDLDFTRKHTIIEIVESYKKYKPSLNHTD